MSGELTCEFAPITVSTAPTILDRLGEIRNLITQVLAIIFYDIISPAFNDAVKCTINHQERIPTLCLALAIMLGIYACVAYTWSTYRLLRVGDKGCRCRVCPGDHLSAKKVAYIAASFLALTTFVHDMYHVYQVDSADVVSPATRQDLVPYISRLALLCYFVPVIWLYCRSQRRVKINYLLNQAHKAPPAWCPKLNHAKNVNELPFGTVRKFFRGIYLVSKACVRLYWTNLVRGPVDQDAPIDYWDFDHVYTWVHGEFCDELTPNQSYHSKQNAQYVKRLRERPPSRLKRIA